MGEEYGCVQREGSLTPAWERPRSALQLDQWRSIMQIAQAHENIVASVPLQP